MKAWLIVATVLYSIALLPSLALLGAVPTLFKAGGSANTQALWLVYNCLQMLPVLMVVGIAGMWIWYKKGVKKIAIAFSLLPVADALLIVIGYIFITSTP